MTATGSGSGVDRQALVISPSIVIAEQAAQPYVAQLRTDGLPRVTVVVQRLVNAATDLSVGLEGQTGNDTWLPIAPPTAVPAAAVGQVVSVQIPGVAYRMVRAVMADTSVVAHGATTVTVQLMATFT